MSSRASSLLTLIKKKNEGAVVILVFVLVAFYSDVVFGGRTFLMETAALGTMPGAGPYHYEGAQPGFVVNDAGAIAWYGEPLNRFISRSVQKGNFPLWNPYAGLAGSPLLADGQTGPLEPIQFLFFFVPDRLWPLAVDIQLLLRFLIAGFACYLFARRQDIDFLGSIAAAILFMFSSYFVTYGNHPQIKTEALLPLVVYGFDRLVDPNDRAGFWLCALFTGWAIAAAMPESTFFALFLGTLWYFYRSLAQAQKDHQITLNAKHLLLRYLGSTCLGFLISAAYLLPFLELVRLAKSIHAPEIGRDAYALQLLPGLLFQIRTKFFLHLGFFALFSLVFSFLNLNNWSKFRQQITFFGLYAAIFLSTMFGFPLTSWLRDLPVFNQLDFGKYPLPSILFCLAILTGILTDRAREIPLSYQKLSISLLVLSILFIGLPGVKNLESWSAYSSDTVLVNVALLLIITRCIVLYLVAFYQARHRLSPSLVQIVLLVMIALEPFFWVLRINRPDRFDPFQPPPFMQALKEKEGFRIFGLDGTLYPNISTAYALADVRWLSALAPQRAYDFSSRFIESNEVNTLRLTGTVLPVSDKMFDLLNVKYVLRQNSYIKTAENCSFTTVTTDRQPYFGSDTLNPLIYEQNQHKDHFFPPLPLNINGATRTSIFAAAPERFDLNILIPEKAPELDFSIGLNPKIFLPEYGDGVTFRVILMEPDQRLELFSKYIDPKNHPCDRRWFDESLNLEKWAGKRVVLRFVTTGGPAGDTSSDLAYWGDIRFVPPPGSSRTAGETAGTAYSLAYQDQDVLIYQKKEVYPPAFVVHDLMDASSFNQALDLLANPELDLSRMAVVENFPADLQGLIEKNRQENPSGLAEVKRVDSDSLAVEVETDSPGRLILSEQYYPGWRAYVDGKETHIYPVDGILRGIFLDKGQHTVRFEYRPLSFLIGLIVTIVSLLGTVACLVYFSRRPSHLES